MILDGIPLVRADGSSNDTSPSSSLIVLVFSASWCPDCTRFIPRLAEACKAERGGDPAPADIVLVSSDRSRDDMHKYMRECLGDWRAVNFDGSHRAALKKRLGVCAASEMGELGIDSASRKDGIPTVAVFRNSDGALVTLAGVRDVEEAGAGVFRRWKLAAAALE
ncbi:unnamed protein product [Discosporangium mesarthrocarpum]